MDLTILGAFEVDAEGSLANWVVPGKMVKGMGGAMDLVAGARRVVVTMEHTTKNGGPRLVRQCSPPLTDVACVHLVITETAVIERMNGQWILREVMPGFTVEQIVAAREAPLFVDPNVRLLTEECVS